jgi:simple sugar transport system permease protein
MSRPEPMEGSDHKAVCHRVTAGAVRERRWWFGSHESALGVVLLLLIGVFGWWNPAFMTLGNAADLVNSHCFLALLAVGVFVVLVSGGIDVSFTATAAVAQYVTMLLLVRMGGDVVTGICVGSVIGIVLGMVNALLIHAVRVPSIIVTLATLNVYQGLLTGLSGGRWIYLLPSWFQRLGGWQLRFGTETAGWGLSVGVLVLGLVVMGTWVLLRWTMLGRGLYALGGSEGAARRVGMNVLGIRLFVYGYLGWLAALAGLVNALQVQVVSPGAIVGRELDVFAAVVLGGAGIAGGSGTLRGTLLGVALIAVLSNGLTLMHVPSIWTRMLVGMVLIASVVLATWRERAGRNRGCDVGKDGL